VAENPESNSFLIYDDSSIKQKIKNWTEKIPWIKPHYAIKSNPIQVLVKDIFDS